MSKIIISEGKTTNEAIENGLKELNVSKKDVDIKVLENTEKRSFFNILAPRVVKVQLTVKEKNEEKENKKIKKEIVLSKEEKEKAKSNVEKFLKEFFESMGQSPEYAVVNTDMGLNVNINGQNMGFLIGYRGETLYSFQNIISAIASKGLTAKIRVILDIEGYKEKRKKTLEELAEKIARNVIKSKKSITLEPMQAYERKIIHSKLQENEKVQTRSIGEEPRRRIVVSLKRN